MGTYNKMVMLVSGLILLALLLIIMYLGMENSKHLAEIDTLRTRLTECSLQQNVVTSAIERQNAAIQAIKIDTLYVERETQSIVTRYSVVRDTITKNMERDSSAENMLYNIVDVLRNFHGVGLRSASDN